jgi:hypothetical protein
MAFAHMPRDGARYDVARLKLGPALPCHEALAALVYQHGSFAPYGFADERHGIASDIERGWMELYELHVGEFGAGARRESET